MCSTNVYQTDTTYWLALILSEPHEASVSSVDHTAIKGMCVMINAPFEDSVGIENGNCPLRNVFLFKQVVSYPQVLLKIPFLKSGRMGEYSHKHTASRDNNHT